MLRGFFVAVLFCVMGLIQPCFADVALSVNPIDGSNRLRFEQIPSGGIENKEQIHVRVSSTNGSRYQVFQRVLEPIVNEKGDALNLQAISAQTLPNSNNSGTLYLQNSDHVGMGDQLLYSSSQNGDSDSFMIGYSLDRSLVNTSGSFRGRLVFTVRSGTSSDQVTIDVFLETSSGLKVSVKGAHDPMGVHIQGSDTTEKGADSVNISFSGNSGQEIRIYQVAETMPQNETEQELGTEVLQLDTQGQTEGLRVPGLSLLRPGRSLIYSGSEAEGNFLIYFLVSADQLQKQAAGIYTGKIKYEVETSQGTREFPINVQCNIPSEFSMTVTTPPGGVSFSHILANSPPQDQEVLVTVISNLHQPYQVLQDLQANMTNSQGKEFDNKYFTLQVQVLPGQNGRTDYTEFLPMKTGEYPVFSSNSMGDGASFKVVYRLQGYAQMNPGDFSAPIRFSLNQK